MAKAITDREENYSQWYNDIVHKAGLADHSNVRGCMVIKPHGYAIWEKMRDELDRRFKDSGHVNAYFPLFIPKHFFNREAKHVKGFAKECAVVTHHRLKEGEDGEITVDPEAKLEEELIIRPTSETIIWDSFRNWIDSYRDLPLLINQWANVVRWEMRTRMFLRTSEFLWQEGHTAHETAEEAHEEALRMHRIYAEFAENVMAMPVIRGRKTPSERFAGAEETYTIEAMMQDGKALQAGTSHFLGQNFARAFDVKYLDDNNEEQYVWATSWGVSTRLIGGLIMTHSDDRGLVLPPKLAPVHVVIVPIPKPDEDFIPVIQRLKQQLKDRGLTVEYDDDDRKRPGYKFAEHEMRGIPVRIGIGKRELEKGTVEIARRDTGEKEFISIEAATERIGELMHEIQDNLFDRAQAYQDEMITEVDDYNRFKEVIEEKGGFVSAHWDGTEETEARIKDETKATIRCIPEGYEEDEAGSCILSGEPSQGRVLFAKAY